MNSASGSDVVGVERLRLRAPSDNPKIAYGLLRHLVDKIEGHVHEMTHLKEYYLDDAECVLISYGSTARSALHVVENRRARGERLGLLELQTIWPFPAHAIRERCERAKYVVVVEMNMGQIVQEVKKALDDPEKVFLANRIDGTFISPTDIRNVLRVIQGKGV